MSVRTPYARSIKTLDGALIHRVRENTGIGGGGYASWCDKAYYNPAYIVDEPVTCLWCAARRPYSAWAAIMDGATNPCSEVPL